MSTCRAIAELCVKRFGVIGASDVLEADEAVDAQSLLSGMYRDALSKSAQPGLTRTLISAAYTAGEDELIQADASGPYTITLPVTLTDTCTGETRAPKDRAVVMIAGATPQGFIYDEAYGDWIDACTLLQTDYAPLSNMDQESLTAALAMYLASTYSRQLDPLLLSLAGRGRDWLYGKLRKPKRVSVDAPLLRINRWR